MSIRSKGRRSEKPRGGHGRRASPAHRDAGAPSAGDERGERLQKALASAGLGSRRKCEELIVAGRVEVDRRVVRELGVRVHADRQEIRVDGQPISRGRLVHYMVNKPVGLVSTNRDPSGRPRVIDLLPPSKERLFTVGRLDLSSEGLILLTNDGELAHRLAHPRFGVEKTYQVLVAGQTEAGLPQRLKQGVHLAEGWARAVDVRVKTRHKQSTLLEIVLDEGRNREIRRLLARLGHKVLTLKRIALGEVRLGDLKPGEYRRLRHDELQALRAAAQAAPAGRKPRTRLIDETASEAADEAEDVSAVEPRAGRGATPRRNVIGAEAPRADRPKPRPGNRQRAARDKARGPGQFKKPRGPKTAGRGRQHRGAPPVDFEESP